MSLRSKVTVIVCCLGILTPTAAAQASHTIYDPDDWYSYWDASVSDGVNLKWRWTDGFPTSHRSAVYMAVQDWNAVSAPLNWLRQQPDYADFSLASCTQIPWRKNAIHATYESSKPPAWMIPCYGTHMNKANMVINTWWNWNTDPNLFPAWYQTDLRAGATHEWGHMHGQIFGGGDGQGHFWESQNTDLCPDAGMSNHALRESLCPGVEPGYIVQRVPAAHEVQLLKYAY
jgi:hypothetical protein